MAKPQKQETKTMTVAEWAEKYGEAAPEPESRAYAVLTVKGGLWTMRTYAIQGDRVLAFVDTEPDALPETMGRAVQALEEGK